MIDKNERYLFKQTRGLNRAYHGVLLSIVESRPPTAKFGLRFIVKMLPVFAIWVEFFRMFLFNFYSVFIRFYLFYLIELLSFVMTSSTSIIPSQLDTIANFVRLRFVFPSVQVFRHHHVIIATLSPPSSSSVCLILIANLL